MTTADQSAVELLASLASEITDIDVEGHAVPVAPSDWIDWFNGRYFAADADILETLEALPNEISRAYLFRLAKLTQETGFAQEAVKKLWITTYVWGGGRGATGYRARVFARLTLFDTRYSSVMLATVEALQRSDISGAHAAIDQLVTAGEGFFTKFLYFFSKPNVCEPLPLIYDEQVKIALRTLVGANKWALALGAPPDNSRAEIYAFYVVTMHRWARLIGCTPEQLELFLFRRRGSIAGT